MAGWVHGLANVGAAVGEAEQLRRQAALEQLRAKLTEMGLLQEQQRLGLQQAEFNQKMQQGKTPKYLYSYSGADGKIRNVVQDPVTGEVSEQTGGAEAPKAPAGLMEKLAAYRQVTGKDPDPDTFKQMLGIKPPAPKFTTDKPVWDPKSPTKWSLEGMNLNTGQIYRIPGAPDPYRGKEGSAGGGGASDAAIEAYAQRLAANQMSLDQLSKIMVGKTGDALRKKITDRAMELGWNATAQLSPAAQTVLIRTTPVLNQVDSLIGDIKDMKLEKNNTAGYLFGARAKYALGMASPEGTLAHDIAGLSLGSVVEAASALQGSSRSIQALRKALVHTPNPWRDSPALIYEKLTTIRQRLQDIVNDAQRYGSKSGLENVPQGAAPGISAPASQADPLGLLGK
jgi:hypothetical protein